MNTFDRILWRANGILFLAALIGALGLIIYVFSQSSSSSSQQKEDAAVVTTDAHQGKQYLHLRGGTFLEGLSLLRFALSESDSYGSFSSSGYDGAIRNYLFVNPADLRSWWLLPDHKYIIKVVHDLYSPRTGDRRRVVGSVYEIITVDTDADGRISQDDGGTAYFSQNIEAARQQLTPNAARIISVDQITDSEAMIVFQNGSETKAKTISIADGSTIMEKLIPLNK